MSSNTDKTMHELAISEFKARCLALVDQVSKTKTTLRLTQRGKPMADVVPIEQQPDMSWFGSMEGKIEILADIAGPADDIDDWEVLRD